MTEIDIIEAISYLVGAFALGFGCGSLTAALKRSLDLL
jgi:hypothetical protein